jgi:hypothetical protein
MDYIEQRPETCRPILVDGQSSCHAAIWPIFLPWHQLVCRTSPRQSPVQCLGEVRHTNRLMPWKEVWPNNVRREFLIGCILSCKIFKTSVVSKCLNNSRSSISSHSFRSDSLSLLFRTLFVAGSIHGHSWSSRSDGLVGPSVLHSSNGGQEIIEKSIMSY